MASAANKDPPDNIDLFSWGRSELTDRNVELYPQFFLELITTQLRFYMVSPQLSLLIILLTMQSYKFYLLIYLLKPLADGINIMDAGRFAGIFAEWGLRGQLSLERRVEPRCW